MPFKFARSVPLEQQRATGSAHGPPQKKTNTLPECRSDSRELPPLQLSNNLFERSPPLATTAYCSQSHSSPHNCNALRMRSKQESKTTVMITIRACVPLALPIALAKEISVHQDDEQTKTPALSNNYRTNFGVRWRSSHYLASG